MVKSDSSDESGDEMMEHGSEKAQLASSSENKQSETGSQNDQDDDKQSVASAASSENNDEPDDVIESGDGNIVSSPKGSAEAVDSVGEDSDDGLKKLQRNIVSSDEDASENGEEAAAPVRTVVIDEEEQGDDPQADISSKDNTGADESILNKDDFDDGGSTPKSVTGKNDESSAKKSKAVLGSDSDDSDAEKTAEKKPEDVEKLMNNIFGEDSSDEGEGNEKEKGEKNAEDSDDADAKFLRVERDSDDGGHEWDFDAMLKKKKAERRRKHKRKGDSILLISDSDDQVKALVDQMHEAAAEDRASNQDKRPAIQKRKMLSTLRSTLMKADLFETLLDNGMMSGISEWLAPLPDKSLPALEVRSTLLKILEGYPSLDQGILKQSGLGKAVMFLFKHPKETRENKTIAAKLIREWSRPIFQLDTDFRSLSRDERVQRDFEHMPVVKRRKLSIDADGLPTAPSRRGKPETDLDESGEKGLNPGQVGFVNRARVPKPSTKDYVIRPRPQIEGRFQGASKNRQTDRFDKAQREFRDRNKAQKAKRAVGVSIEGRKMDI